MGEKIVVFIAVALIVVFLPYGVTMLMTGYEADAESISSSGILVEYEEEGQVKVLDLEEYMVGVLAATIPPDYQEETYQALAIAVRTNGRRLQVQGKNIIGKDLSGEYLTESQMREEFGESRYLEHMQKIKNAITSTYGQVVTFDGDYIDALYHTASIGRTASAKDVYHQDIPYLSSVESNMDVECKDYMQIVNLSKEELSDRLNQEVSLEEIVVSQTSEEGYVQKVKVKDQELTGEEFRQKCGLHSLYFYIEKQADSLRFVCLGKGHGLGISLYGANQMALQKKSAKEILEYYYSGAKVENIAK